MNSSTENILGYSVYSDELSAFVDSVLQTNTLDTRCRFLACLNPHSYVLAKNDSDFSKALFSANWLVPDGAGIVLASRLLGGKIRRRITGSDVFLSVSDRLEKCGGYSVFFLGSTETTLAEICAKMEANFPHIKVVGAYSPPFKTTYSEEETIAILDAINASAADVLWVGMTSPKQDIWIHANQDRLKVKFAAGIGAVFDFYAGRVKRSHPVFQNVGLEWLPRLLQEPRRLWRRMFISAPIFLFDLLRRAIGLHLRG